MASLHGKPCNTNLCELTVTDDGKRRVLASRNKAWVQYIAKSLTKTSISPNQISVLSTIFSLIAAYGFYKLREHPDSLWSLLVVAGIQLRLFCNLMDGLVAVEGGKKSVLGDLFNDIPDRISDALIFIGLGYSISSHFLGWHLAWLAGLLSISTAYVRYVGAATVNYHFYLGPMAKQHRMALLTVSSLLTPFCGGIESLKNNNLLYLTLLLINFGLIVTLVRRTKKIAEELKKHG